MQFFFAALLSFLSLLICGVSPAAAEGYLSAEQLRTRSSEVITKIRKGEDGPASGLIDNLLVDAGHGGVRSFPELSLDVLNVAVSEKAPERRAFLLRTAIRLSPESPRLLLVASRTAFAEGIPGGWDALRRALSVLPLSPALTVSLGSDLFVVMLLSLTMGLFLLAACQLAASGAQLIEGIGDILPGNCRGILAPVILALVLIAPLPFGILSALAVWCFVVAIFLPSCRWCGALAGVTALSWALLMPVSQAILPRVHSELHTVVEEVNGGAFLPKAESVLTYGIRAGELPAAVAMMQLFLRDQKLEQAESVGLKILTNPRLGESLRRTVYVLLGQTAFHSGKFDLAKEFLSRAAELGEQSFELSFYLSQTAVASANLPEHEKYYAEANAIDPGRLRDLIIGDSRTPPLSTAPVSFQELARPLLRPLPGASARQSLFEDLEGRLFPVAGELNRLWFTGTILIAGFFVRFRERLYLRFRSIKQGERHSVWRFVPGGALLASSRPVLGAGVVTVGIVLLFLAADSPIRTTVLGAVTSPAQLAFALLAFIVFFAPALLLSNSEPAPSRRRRR